MIYTLTDNDLRIASAVLRVRGVDANSYLQGQFTQDVNTTTGGRSYGLWLDQKGRCLADGDVLKKADNEYLVVSFSITAKDLLARLEAYLIADEVELIDETADWAGILLWGDGATTIVAPAQTLTFASRRAGSGSVQWLLRRAHLEAAQTGLRKIGAQERDVAAAELNRLLQGVPAVPMDIGPRDLPNEGGLDEVAISYTKGCYLGQEVMARLKNLGQVRRRLHLVRGPGVPPAAGTSLHQGERRVGELRSAVLDGDGFLAMAMVSLVNLKADEPVGLSPDGPAEIKILRRV